MEKFDGVDFMEIDSLFSDEEILIRDTARKVVERELKPLPPASRGLLDKSPFPVYN